MRCAMHAFHIAHHHQCVRCNDCYAYIASHRTSSVRAMQCNACDASRMRAVQCMRCDAIRGLVLATTGEDFDDTVCSKRTHFPLLVRCSRIVRGISDVSPRPRGKTSMTQCVRKGHIIPANLKILFLDFVRF